MWTWLWLLLSTALAVPGHEIALVLDNSCSMVAGGRIQGTSRELPPNDPERAAVLGTLLVEGLIRGSEDRLTVIGFGDRREAPPRVVRSADDIRAMPYGGGTWFAPALRAAHGTLQATDHDGRLLLLFTDGSPSDLDRPQEALDLIGDSPVIALGLYGSADFADMGRPFLERMVAVPDDLTMLDATRPDVVQSVVQAFTTSYARLLGSKPVTGELAPGGSTSFPVGRYVTEVLVTTASVAPGGPYTAALNGPAGPVPVRASGDNGCPRNVAPGNARTVCDPPRRHYATFRAANDPYQASTWTLSIPSGPGAVQYGIILRYDLVADLAMPASSRVGEPVPIDARLLFRGQVFQDDAFFQSDDFAATLLVGDEKVALKHVGAGRFQGTWTPQVPGPVRATVLFNNRWMQARDTADVAVEGFLDLVLTPSPNPVDLGAWEGLRGRSRRCATVDLAGSTNADKVPVICLAAGHSSEAVLTCGPIAGSQAAGMQPLLWEVCVIAEPCCGDLPVGDDEPFTVTLRGQHDHYAPGAVTVPVSYRVQRTSFLRCWWVEIAVALGLITLGIIVWGLISPNSFDTALTVRVAGSEAALRRASALVLCEQPGGRRGFYRHARFSIMNDGTPVRDARPAMLVVEAGPRGSTRWRKAAGLERMDKRTRKWVPIGEEEAARGIDTGATYRAGPVWLKFE